MERNRGAGRVDADMFALCLVPRQLHTYLGQVRVVAIDGTYNTDKDKHNKVVWLVGVTSHPVRVPVMLVICANEGTQWSAAKAWGALKAYAGRHQVSGMTSGTEDGWYPQYVLTDNLGTWPRAAETTWPGCKVTRLMCLWHMYHSVCPLLGAEAFPRALSHRIHDDIALLADCSSPAIFESAGKAIVTEWKLQAADLDGNERSAVEKFLDVFEGSWWGEKGNWGYAHGPRGCPRASPAEAWPA
jgi:hypothetical protein